MTWELIVASFSFRWCTCGFFTIQKSNLESHARTCKVLAELNRKRSSTLSVGNDSGSLPLAPSDLMDILPPNQPNQAQNTDPGPAIPTPLPLGIPEIHTTHFELYPSLHTVYPLATESNCASIRQGNGSQLNVRPPADFDVPVMTMNNVEPTAPVAFPIPPPTLQQSHAGPSYAGHSGLYEALIPPVAELAFPYINNSLYSNNPRLQQYHMAEQVLPTATSSVFNDSFPSIDQIMGVPQWSEYSNYSGHGDHFYTARYGSVGNDIYTPVAPHLHHLHSANTTVNRNIHPTNGYRFAGVLVTQQNWENPNDMETLYNAFYPVRDQRS